MKKRIVKGETYWDLKKKYGHTSAIFSSGPELVSTVLKLYGVDVTYTEKEQVIDWSAEGKTNKIGMLIIDKVPHLVPAFYAISYNSN